MKRRKWLAAGVFVLIAAGLLALSGCAGPEGGWSIVGAWVNPEYVGETNESGPRVEYKTDNTFTAYDDLEGDTVRATGSVEITEEWTEQGSLWYKLSTTVEGDSDSPYYSLGRIFDNGNTQEGWMSTGDSYPDPETVERGGSDYSIWYREGA
ncbi:MAG: hypothetical protein ACLFRY_02225 [Spirochaetia bacterium]